MNGIWRDDWAIDDNEDERPKALHASGLTFDFVRMDLDGEGNMGWYVAPHASSTGRYTEVRKAIGDEVFGGLMRQLADQALILWRERGYVDESPFGPGNA